MEPVCDLSSLLTPSLHSPHPPQVGVLAAAHITGEGHPGNIPRVLPKGLTARIHKNSWKRPEIYNWMQKAGNVSEDQMFLTFNMGIGACWGSVLVLGWSGSDGGYAVRMRCVVNARVG